MVVHIMKDITEETRQLLIEDVKRWVNDNEWCSHLIIKVARRKYGVELTARDIEKLVADEMP